MRTRCLVPPSRCQVALLRGPSKGLTDEMLRGIARYVREHQPWDFFSDNDPMFRPLPPLRQWRGDGILCFVRTAGPAQEITRCSIPAVNVSSACRDLGIARVIGDNLAVGQLAAESLLATGLHHFGYVGMPGIAWSSDREAGFVSAIRDAGRSVSVFDSPRKLRRFFLRTTTRRDWKLLQPYLAQWIATLKTPVGILGCNDVASRHVIETCHEMGLHIPEQVAILGVDNEVMRCELCLPPLSSVDTDQQRIGYEAAALLDQLMGGRKQPHEPILVKPRGIVIRPSSDTLAIADKEVATAVSLIRDRGGSISVGQIVDQVLLSRRMLEIRTQKALGRTLRQEISRVRTQRITQLLTHTDMALIRIAKAAAFASVGRMAAFFKSHSGMTPVECRRRYGKV